MAGGAIGMKLVVVTNILTPYRVPLFEAIARKCEQLTVFLMAEREENRQWEIGSVSFRTELLPGWHIRPKGTEVSFHLNYGMVKRLRRFDPDVVLSGGFAPAHLAAFTYCKLFHKRYVQWGELTLRDGAQSSSVRRLLRRTLIGGADACIASSNEARDTFRHYGVASRPILTTPMPIEIERIHDEVVAIRQTAEHAARRNRYPGPVLLSVGRLLDAKGCRHLFELYEQVHADRPDVSLVLVGDGPDRAAYETFCRDRGWVQVHFIGHVESSSLSQYLALGDLFIFPTLSDTFGAVLSEAMAAELPVLSSIHAAATRDLVQDGLNGWAFDPLIPERGTARVLEFLATSPIQQRTMSHAAYQAVRHTDVGPSTDAMVQFLESIAPPASGVDIQAPATEEPGHAVTPARAPLLIIGPTPPPYHGVAMAIQTLLDSRLSESFNVHHLELADRRGISHVNTPDWHDVILFCRQWVRLIWLLIRRRPTIVYFVLSQSTIGVLRDSFFVWPARLFGAKVLAHLHGAALHDWYVSRGFSMRLYTRLLMRTVTRAIVLGESLREQFQGLVAPERIAVVPNGIPDCGIGSIGLPRLRRRWQVLYLNTLNKMKGAMVLLEAIAQVCQQRTDVEFIFAGPWSHDEHRKEAEAYIAQLAIGSSITCTGQVSGTQKTALLHAADLFVFPGIQQEGQPLVVLEAMAAGLPILFTNRGCLRETLSDGESGIEVPIGDAAALADRIQWLLSRPDEMKRLGANARLQFEREYTSERHLDRMTATFAGIAAYPDTCKHPILLKSFECEARRSDSIT
jgi:glycosyltransferase involved in cell wall biosynthesis